MDQDETEEEGISLMQIAKLLLELGPLIVFFVANAKFGIFTATAAFMVAMVIALTASYILFRRIAAMPLVVGVFVLVFGGLTLWLHDDVFIKLKPTIVNSLFAVFLFAGLGFGKPLLKILFGDIFQLTERGWKLLTVRWAFFFVLLAILNEIVWRNFSTDIWVSFKVFGIMPLTFVFALSQIGFLQRHQADKSE